MGKYAKVSTVHLRLQTNRRLVLKTNRVPLVKWVPVGHGYAAAPAPAAADATSGASAAGHVEQHQQRQHQRQTQQAELQHNK